MSFKYIFWSRERVAIQAPHYKQFYATKIFNETLSAHSGNSTFFHPKPDETVSNVWAKHASLPAGTGYEKEEATTGAVSAESQMSRKGPQAERMRGMQMTPKGACAVDTLSVRTAGFSQFCSVSSF